jgi:hypothetical protein
MEKYIDDLKKSLSCINDNKYIIGLTMIMLNIGARFIIDELDDDLRSLVTNAYIRRVVIFCSFFMATKDLFTAIVLTIIFVILINEVFAKELDDIDDEDEKKGGSFNKKELEKAVNTLKSVQMNM